MPEPEAAPSMAPGPPSPSDGAVRAQRTPSGKWRQKLLHTALVPFVTSPPRTPPQQSRVRRMSISPRIIGESLVAPSSSGRGIGSTDLHSSPRSRAHHRRSSSFPFGIGGSSADLPPTLDEAEGEDARPVEKLASAAVIGLQERYRAHAIEESERWTAIRKRRASYGASSALRSADDHQLVETPAA